MPNLEFDAELLYRELANQVKAALKGDEVVALVGIYSGGAWIAERLAKELNVTQLGSIDVSLHRDDYAEKGLPTEVKPTHIPFSVEGATVLLVDDVLYTGRTTRAAINELFDFGRPKRVMLAALVDRGGRQLPVAADFVARTVSLSSDQRLVLQRAGDDSSGRFTLTVEHA